MTHKQIREILGHNGIECRVVIRRDGTITRHGSPDPYSRGHDYWHLVGHVDEYQEAAQ